MEIENGDGAGGGNRQVDQRDQRHRTKGRQTDRQTAATAVKSGPRTQDPLPGGSTREQITPSAPWTNLDRGRGIEARC